MARLGDVITVSASSLKFDSSKAWLLNLDMVEQQTGEIISYNYVTLDKLDGSIIQFDTDNVLYSKLRPNLNKVVIPTRPGFATSEMLPLRPNTNVLTKEYLAAYLRSDSFVEWAVSKTSGAKMPRLGTKELLNKEIPIPTIEMQKHITGILDKIAGLASLRKHQLAKLDELVKARFVEMFGDKKKWSNWPQATIEDISIDMRTGPFGSALHHDEFVDEGVFVLGIDNAVENRFSYNRMRYITEEKYEQLKRYTVKPGDVIITIMGTVGRSAVIPEDMPRAINTKHLACITPDKSRVNSYFLSCAFQTHPVIQAQLKKQAKGAIMDGLNLTIIKKLSFALPPIEMQNQFVAYYMQTDKFKLTIQQSLDKLEMLKKLLMQEYFG